MAPRLRRLVLGIVLALAAPIGVVLLSHRAAELGGVRAGRVLSEWASALPRSPRSASSELSPLSPDVPALEPAAVQSAAPRPARSRRSRAPAAPAASARRGVFVPARAVLALARAAVLPHAVPVAASGARPAGLRLTNVGNLGIGMHEGDVLVRVAGAPVSSVPAVADLVLRARARHARDISAEFWRDGAPWSLVVEQPYVDSGESRFAAP